MLTNTNGVSTYVDTGIPYQNGQWYELAVTVDLRTSNPIFTFMVNGAPVYTYVDTLGGLDLDHPARLDVGLGPGSWGATMGTVYVDDVAIWDAGSPSTTTVSA